MQPQTPISRSWPPYPSKPILGAVLDISRLDTRALKPSPSVFQLAGLMRQLTTDFMPLAEEKGLKLTIIPSTLTVNTDRNLLRRLVQNLVSNAIKYTPSGRVLVGVRRRGELLELQVIDTGIGIASDKLNTVFREFTRLEEGVRQAQGLGLGLSIVDRIARVLNLEIRLDSQIDGGTRFSVIIPISSSQANATDVPARPAAIQQTMLEGLRVLCIDNDPRILDGMRRLLEGWGCVVSTATGSSSLPDFSDSAPNIILADYHLDNEVGLDVILALRGRYGETIPAILITADRSNEVRAEAEALTAMVLNKPLRPASLRTLLMRCRQMLAAAE